MIHMVRSREGEDLAGAVVVGAIMARANMAGVNVAGANVAGARSPVVGSYVCRDHRSVQHCGLG